MKVLCSQTSSRLAPLAFPLSRLRVRAGCVATHAACGIGRGNQPRKQIQPIHVLCSGKSHRCNVAASQEPSCTHRFRTLPSKFVETVQHGLAKTLGCVAEVQMRTNSMCTCKLNHCAVPHLCRRAMQFAATLHGTSDTKLMCTLQIAWFRCDISIVAVRVVVRFSCVRGEVQSLIGSSASSTMCCRRRTVDTRM
jgi:hypothetical protein